MKRLGGFEPHFPPHGRGIHVLERHTLFLISPSPTPTLPAEKRAGSLPFFGLLGWDCRAAHEMQQVCVLSISHQLLTHSLRLGLLLYSELDVGVGVGWSSTHIC